MKLIKLYLRITVLCCFITLIQAKLMFNDVNRSGPPSVVPIRNTMPNLFSSDSLCIWTDQILTESVTDTLDLITLHSTHTVIYSDIEQIHITAKECYNNILFTSNLSKTIFEDRVPTSKHSFLVFYHDSNVEILNVETEMFGLANTVLVQGSSIYRLSSPYFPPRVFESVSYVPVAKQEIPKDLKGRNITIATFNCSLFSILHEPISSGDPDGIEMKMMQELSHKLNFTPQFFDLSKNKWGSVLPNGTWRGGIMGALQSGEAEFGFCNVWNVAAYVSAVDFGPSWNTVYFKYMVPRPHLVRGFWFIVVQLFQSSVWIMIVALFIFVSYLCWKYKEPSNSGKVLDAVLSVLTTFGILISWSLYFPSKVKFVHHILICWSIFSFFISTLFCNTIITRLMIPQISSIVDSLDDIVHENLWVTYPGYVSKTVENKSKIKEETAESEEDHWNTKMEGLFRDVSSNESTAALRSEKFVFPVQCLDLEYVFINVDGLDISYLERYRVMSQTLDTYHVSIAFSRKSAILDLSQYYLNRFMEVGLVRGWMKTVILNYGSEQVKHLLSNTRLETFDTYEPLTVSNNIAAFRIIILGWCLSFLIFLIECIVGKKYCVK